MLSVTVFTMKCCYDNLHYFQSQIFMMEQSKRSMELQLSRKSVYCSMLERQSSDQRNLYQAERKKKKQLKDKIKQLKVIDVFEIVYM